MRQDRLSQRDRQPQGARERKHYYWLYTVDEDGKPHLIYGAEDESSARTRGLELLGGMDFEIKRLPTRSLPAASSMIRGVRLESTHSLKKASRRIGHERSLKRMRQRRTSSW